MDPEILAGADALRSLAPQALGTDGGRLNVSYAYSDVSHAYSDEDLACWCYDIFGSDGTLVAQGRKSWTGGRCIRDRSNLFAAPRRRGRLPLLGLVLLVGALGGLVACHGGSSATIAMDTQYYDDRGSILEIPQITGDRSEAAQAINAALLARKAVYQTYVDDPYRDASWCEVTAWPTTTDRYLNLALVENVYPTYGKMCIRDRCESPARRWARRPG